MKKSAKEIIFAVPGSKVYISKYYNNRVNSFLNISLTGKKCELMCSHCKGRLLSDMIDVDSTDFVLPDDLKLKENRVMEIILRHQDKDAGSDDDAVKGDIAMGIGLANRKSRVDMHTNTDNKAKANETANSQTSVNGILISGGFDSHGRLPLDGRILPELKEVKNKYGREIKVLMHLGFTDRQTAESLHECGIDGVLVNIFSDKHSIEEIYNLKGFSPSMFYENVHLLKDAGLRVSPHLILGLGDSSLSGEYRSVKEIAESGADSCVFAIVKNISRQDRLTLPEVKPLDVIKLFEYAISIMPDTPVILGCARPHGKEFDKMEIELIKLGVSVIAFPSERTLDYAKKNNYRFHFEEQCCAFLVNH
jgi:uncharacterized radical SAM superfamily protein